MLKFLTSSFLIISLCRASVIQVPLHSQEREALPLDSQIGIELWEKWGPHVMDFLNLVDKEKFMGVVMNHIADPDLINFVQFLDSAEFKKVLADFQTIEEFKEAVDYLQSKGYNAQFVIDTVNSLLESTIFTSPKVDEKFGSGITDLIEEVTKTLPVDKIKDLIRSKLQTEEDVARLFQTITSPEFKKIAERTVENPKFLEIKHVFEGYGFDFKRLEKLAGEVFGDFFEGLV